MHNPVTIHLTNEEVVHINSVKRVDATQGVTFFDINGDMLFFPYTSISYLTMGPNKEE